MKVDINGGWWVWMIMMKVMDENKFLLLKIDIPLMFLLLKKRLFQIYPLKINFFNFIIWYFNLTQLNTKLHY